MNLLWVIPIAVVVFEWITRFACPDYIIRPSNLIIATSKFVGESLYTLGTKLAFLLDYMTYKYLLENLGRILKEILTTLHRYIRLLFQKIYKYTPIEDVFNLLGSFVDFVTSFGQFFVGYNKYYQQIIANLHFEGYVRKIVAFGIVIVLFVTGLVFFNVSLLSKEIAGIAIKVIIAINLFGLVVSLFSSTPSSPEPERSSHINSKSEWWNSNSRFDERCVRPMSRRRSRRTTSPDRYSP